MKTNKDDIRALKSKHRLELVMQETGESFEVDAANSDLWHGTITQGLTVDIRRQTYEIKKPGTDTETGDVLTWLQSRFNWSFAMAITYLKKRPSDPKSETQPAKKINQIIRKNEDEVKPLDTWQENALLIGGERIRKYFSWSWLSLAMYLPETRIEPTHAPEITHCPQCDERINWHFEKTEYRADEYDFVAFKREHIGSIPVIAYSIKRRIDYSGLGLEGSNELKEVFDEAKLSEALQKKINWAIANSFDSLIDVTGALFVEEEDGIVCAKCAWREYDFQIALELCRKSAYSREKVEAEEQRQRDREAAMIAGREREREQERAEQALWERERMREAEKTP
jgi:hypothetical protein